MTFDGLTIEELLELSWEEVEAWICRDDPIIFQASSADILAQFGHKDSVLTAQISVVEGGGDGVLIALLGAIETLARHHRMKTIIWQVHALDCKTPNPKLQTVLEGFHFNVVKPANRLGYYEKITSTNDSVLRRR